MLACEVCLQLCWIFTSTPTQIVGTTTRGSNGLPFPLPVPLTPDRWTGLLCSPALDRTSNYASTPHQTSHPHALLSVWCGSELVRGNKATPLACNLSVDWAWVSSPLPCHCAVFIVGLGRRRRDFLRTWKEGRPPACLPVELRSPGVVLIMARMVVIIVPWR